MLKKSGIFFVLRICLTSLVRSNMYSLRETPANESHLHFNRSFCCAEVFTCKRAMRCQKGGRLRYFGHVDGRVTSKTIQNNQNTRTSYPQMSALGDLGWRNWVGAAFPSLGGCRH